MRTAPIMGANGAECGDWRQKEPLIYVHTYTDDRSGHFKID